MTPPDTSPTSPEAIQLGQLIARTSALLVQLGQASHRLGQLLARGEMQLAKIDEVLGQAAYLAGGIQQLGELERKETTTIERQAEEIRALRVTVQKLDSALALFLGYDRLIVAADREVDGTTR